MQGGILTFDRVELPQDFHVAVKMGETKSPAWREGFLKCWASFNASGAGHFAQIYGLSLDVIPNETGWRIVIAEQLMMENTEALEGFLACWIWRDVTREAFKQVLWGDVPGRQQASGMLRQSMARYLDEGRLDRIS